MEYWKERKRTASLLVCLLYWILYRKILGSWGFSRLLCTKTVLSCFLLPGFVLFSSFLLLPYSFILIPPCRFCACHHHGIGFVEGRGYGWRSLFFMHFPYPLCFLSYSSIWDRPSLSERYQDLGFCYYLLVLMIPPSWSMSSKVTFDLLLDLSGFGNMSFHYVRMVGDIYLRRAGLFPYKSRSVCILCTNKLLQLYPIYKKKKKIQ